MISEILLVHPQDSKPSEVKKLNFFLTGRGGSHHEAAVILKNIFLPNTMGVIIQPDEYCWYPAPIDAENQDEAVEGQLPAMKQILEIVGFYQQVFNVKPEDCIIGGHSAGGVMSIYTTAVSNMPFGACYCLCGCILDTNNFPESQTQTPIITIHNKDDYCFDWKERYIPTKKCLSKKGYRHFHIENHTGSHGFGKRDLLKLENILYKELNIDLGDDFVRYV